MEGLCTAAEAARIIGCEPSRVRQMLRDGTLKGERIGRDWVVVTADAERVRDAPASRGRPRQSQNRPKKPARGRKRT